VRALETGKKAKPFLSCFEAGANDFYMIRQYMLFSYAGLIWEGVPFFVNYNPIFSYAGLI
jgi:hypothetical protein